MIRVDEEFKKLIPPLSEEEYLQLEENIVAEGIRDPLVVWEVPSGDMILIDGHNRWEIAANHGGIRFEIVKKHFNLRKDAIEWIIKNQLGRRNIPAYVRAELALKLKPEIEKKAKDNQRAAGGAVPQKSAKAVDTREEIAKSAGVSHDTIHKVERIINEASDEAKDALRRGETSINAVYSDLVAAERETKRQQADRELREAKKRNEEFEDKKTSDVVGISEIRQNKEDQELIFENFADEFTKMVKEVRNIGAMARDGSLKKMVNSANRRELIQMSEQLSDCYRAITKMQIIITEAIDEK